jgi:hypothetical protein
VLFSVVSAAVPIGGYLQKSPEANRGFFISVILSLSKDQTRFRFYDSIV